MLLLAVIERERGVFVFCTSSRVLSRACLPARLPPSESESLLVLLPRVSSFLLHYNEIGVVGSFLKLGCLVRRVRSSV